MQLVKEDLKFERLFLNGIFYRNQTYNYDILLDHIRLNDQETYYGKIYDVISFCTYTYTFTRDILDFVEAASDFAITRNETFSLPYDRFLSYFYYFGFATVEFRIRYLNYFHSLRRRTKNKKEQSVNHVLTKHFGGKKLLKKKYEISDDAKTILKKRFETIRDEINDFYLRFEKQYKRQVYKFRSDISAVYHYSKHGVMKQIEKKNAVMDIQTYIQEAHRIIHDPKSVKIQVKGRSVFKSGKEKVILSRNNQYISSYIR
jgi:hypothetical protein